MTLTINGTNVVPWIAYGGIKWQRNDIEAADAGRTMDGVMHRGRVSTKMRLDITCVPMKASDLSTLLNLIYPEYVTVTYDDPMQGQVTKRMYSNNNPASFLMIKPDGTEWWSGVTFPLIEV